MAQAQLSCIVRNLRRVVGPSATAVSDAQLLDRFVQERDEVAFELLLRRHERMVLSVCSRILRRQQDVEDAFQATFLTLACKAGSIGKGDAVASWLFKVALRIAWRERSSDQSRTEHERWAGFEKLGTRSSPDPDNVCLESDYRRVLHEEVSRLPEKYRAPVVLCYLEGQTNEQAGVQLRCPAGTIATRLARARRRLRLRLERRGLGMAPVALTTAFASDTLAFSVVPAFRDLTVHAAAVFAADQTAAGLVSTKVVTITRGALKAMFLTKLKFAAALMLLSVGLIGTGAGVFSRLDAAATLGQVQVEAGQDRPSDEPQSSRRRRRDDQERQRDDEPQKQRKRSQATSRHEDSATVTEVVSKTFRTGKSPRVIVELYNGGITVNATGSNSVEARVTKRGRGKTEEDAKEALKTVEVSITQEGDTVRVHASRPEEARQRSSGASAELKVPKGANLELKTVNGAVTLKGGSGQVRVKTSNGKIDVKDSKGELDLHTSNGRVNVTGGTGKLMIKTSNGPISIRGNKAVVNATTSNGSVEFDGSVAEGKHTFHTSNGSIELALPADAAFRLHARTTHGHIKSDFKTDKEDGRLGAGSGRGQGSGRSGTHVFTKQNAVVELSVGENPAASIDVHTSNGSISIHRQGQQREQRQQEQPQRQRRSRDSRDGDDGRE